MQGLYSIYLMVYSVFVLIFYTVCDDVNVLNLNFLFRTVQLFSQPKLKNHVVIYTANSHKTQPKTATGRSSVKSF